MNAIRKKFGLRYEVEQAVVSINATGSKPPITSRLTLELLISDMKHF